MSDANETPGSLSAPAPPWPPAHPLTTVASPLSGVHTVLGGVTYQHDRYVVQSFSYSDSAHGEPPFSSSSSSESASSPLTSASSTAAKPATTESVVHLLAVADGHGSSADGHIVSDYVAARLADKLQQHGCLPPSSAPPAASPSSSSSGSTTTPGTDADDAFGAVAAGADVTRAVTRAVLELDAEAIRECGARRVFSGSTLCAAVVADGGRAVTVAHVGDSRCLVVRRGGGGGALTADHVGTHAGERARVTAAGGIFVGNKVLNGHITVTRALGDDDLKAFRNTTPFPVPGVRPYKPSLFVATPDVLSYAVRPDDVALVVVSDGVTAALHDDAVCRLIAKQRRQLGVGSDDVRVAADGDEVDSLGRRKNNGLGKITSATKKRLRRNSKKVGDGNTAQDAARSLVRSARLRGTNDNCTAVVHWLNTDAGGRGGDTSVHSTMSTTTTTSSVKIDDDDDDDNVDQVDEGSTRATAGAETETAKTVDDEASRQLERAGGNGGNGTNVGDEGSGSGSLKVFGKRVMLSLRVRNAKGWRTSK